MAQAGVGDQLLREKITHLKSRGGRHGSDTVERAEEALGRSALSVEVPVIAVESAHAAALKAYTNAQDTRNQIAEIAARTCPSTGLGWIQLLVSYLALGLLTATTLTHFIRPNSPPVSRDETPPPQSYPNLGNFGTTQVRVSSARIAHDISLEGLPDLAIRGGAPVFEIVVSIKNLSDKPIDYRTWRGAGRSSERDFATLVDSMGNTTLSITNRDNRPPGGGITETSIPPNDTASDVLLFAVPPDDISHVDLFLPGKNVGAKGSIKINVPASVFRPETTEPSDHRP
jgi:hypothetical protein